MDTWLVADGGSELLAVARRALTGGPQVVVPGGRDEDAVVVVSRAEYERLTEPKQDMVSFFRNSPLAEAIRDGLLTPEDICPPRDRESSHRDIDFSDSNA